MSRVQSDRMPEAAFSHQATASAPPDTVWTRLQDPAVWAVVAGVDSTSDHVHQGKALTGFRFTTSIGGVGYQGEARVTTTHAGEAMTISIRSNEVTGEITVDLEASGAATKLAVEMRLRPAGLLGSVVFPIVTGAIRSGFEESVERLAEEMA